MPAEVEVVAVVVVVVVQAVVLDLEVVVQAAVVAEVDLHASWVVELVLHEVVEVVLQEVVAQPALVQHMLVEASVNKPVPAASMHSMAV